MGNWVSQKRRFRCTRSFNWAANLKWNWSQWCWLRRYRRKREFWGSLSSCNSISIQLRRTFSWKRSRLTTFPQWLGRFRSCIIYLPHPLLRSIWYRITALAICKLSLAGSIRRRRRMRLTKWVTELVSANTSALLALPRFWKKSWKRLIVFQLRKKQNLSPFDQ